MKNTAAIALLVARAAAQDRADMDMDRNAPDGSQQFQAATQEDKCKDAGTDVADGALAAQQALVDAEDLKIVATGKLIVAKISDQAAKTIALAKADVTNKAKVDDDIAKDKAELAARRVWDAKKKLELAAKAANVAQDATIKRAQDADDLAKAIYDGAVKAKTDAAAHLADELTLKTTNLATLNAAMADWKGMLFGFTPVTGTVALGTSCTTYDSNGRPGTVGTNTAFTAGKASALLKTAKDNLIAAVGTCGNTAEAAVWVSSGGTCASADTKATALVRSGLRKKLGVDALATAISSRETYLDAYCRAAQQVGATDADIKAGKAYWSRANPGSRLDFKFAAAVGSDSGPGLVTRKNDTLYLSTWTWETLGAPIAAIKINNSANTGTDHVAMADDSGNANPLLRLNSNLWATMKCSDVPIGTPVTTTGNAGRIYGAISGIATTWPNTSADLTSGSATGILAKAVADALTLKNAATSSTTDLEGTFKAWKTVAVSAMTAYDTMITGDAGATYTTVGAFSCNVTSAAIVTTLANCQEAVVNATEVLSSDLTTTVPTAKRPSNLVAAVSAVWNASGTVTRDALIAEAKVECQKLPSMGLYVVSETGMKPLFPKEVCQGIEHQTAVTSASTSTSPKTDRASFISGLKFVSKAAYVSGGGFITIAVTSTAGTTCLKRKNTNGYTWRTTKANVASNFPASDAARKADSGDGANLGAATGKYLPTTTSGNLYAVFAAKVATWTASREVMYAKYSDYLVLKEVVSLTGKQFIDEKVMVARAQARLTGVRGVGNTNGSLTDLYETEWRVVYGDTHSQIPAIAANMSTDTYKLMTPKTPVVSGTSLYAKFVAATTFEQAAKQTWINAETVYKAQCKTYDAQFQIDAQAKIEYNKILLVRPVSAAVAGTKKVLADATAGKTTLLTGTAALEAAAILATGVEKDKFDAAVLLSNAAKIDAATVTAYANIKTARDLADSAVAATILALKNDKDARSARALVFKVKVDKDVLLAKALTLCKNTKYDAYKVTLSTAVSDRKKKLATIKTLLETKDTAKVAAGATGARCNKGLSQGNGKARAAKPCTAETDCCGAAKGPTLAAGAAGYWADAPVMTIETCQPKANKTYKYAPPRAPMQTTDPAAAANAATQQDWPFVCIGGASKLAAAASALATAAYMMA